MPERSFPTITSVMLHASETVGLAAFIYFVGGFSLRKTLTLVGLLGLTWLWYTNSLRAVRAMYNFSSRPYNVWILPKIEKMLSDVGLVPPNWNPPSFNNELAHAWRPSHLIHAGLSAVVISSDVNNKLVHWLGRNSYSKELEYHESLDFLKLSKPHSSLDDLLNCEWSPAFFIRLESKGFEIGLRVLSQWWEANSPAKAEGTKFSKGREEYDGYTWLVFAVLPHEVLYAIYFKTATERYRRKLLNSVEKQLPAFGWKIESPFTREWGKPNVGTDGQVSYMHQYAEISITYVQ